MSATYTCFPIHKQRIEGGIFLYEDNHIVGNFGLPQGYHSIRVLNTDHHCQTVLRKPIRDQHAQTEVVIDDQIQAPDPELEPL